MRGKYKKHQLGYNTNTYVGYVCGCKKKDCYYLLPTEVDHNGICLNCGYYAYYNTIQIPAKGEEENEYRINYYV